MDLMMTDEERAEYRKVQRLLAAEIDYKSKHPQQFNIESYYHANHRDKTKKLVLQKGLANFSSLKFGDERLWYEQSFTQDTFHPKINFDIENKNFGLSKEQVQANRVREYAYAQERVGKDDIEDIEASMREKLSVRPSLNAYQLRKTFKYFDHEGSGGIGYPEIRYAFELLGFQLSETQVMALFATYDTGKTGRITYKDFLHRLSEKDFVEVKDTWLMSKAELETLNNKRRSVAETLKKQKDEAARKAPPSHDDAAEYEESVAFEKSEVCKLFDFVDNTGKGVDEYQLQLLLILMGHGLDKAELARLAKDATAEGARLSFEQFWAWHASRCS